MGESFNFPLYVLSYVVVVVATAAAVVVVFDLRQ